jgi:uncharacterized DUF497 family protein
MKVRIEWEPAKATVNLRKHGLSFEIAALLFADADALFQREGNVAGELRWQILGAVDGFAMLAVAQSIEERDEVEAIRIISARRANRKERRRYEKEIDSI